MPFNGAGAYSLPAGSIVADGTTIDAADHNTPLQDIESSLSTVTLRNGATPFTGNQSFGNNKITSLASGTVATDAATLAQAQSQASNRATAIGGTANAVTLTFSPPFAAYTNGMRIRWRATATNTGAMTVNVDGLGAKNFQMDASGTLAAIFTGAVQNGMFIEAEYNLSADVLVWLNQKPVFMDGSGNAGIGVVPPSYRLDIASNDTTQGYAVRVRSNATAAKSRFQFTTSDGASQNAVIEVSDTPRMGFIVGASERFAVDNGGNALVTNAGGGIGYGTGAGGAVTQATNKSTGVTLNRASGQITMNAASLGAGSTVSFTLTNSSIAATDVVVMQISSGAADPSQYDIRLRPSGGLAIVWLTNRSGGALAEALVLNFAVIKAVNA